MQLFERDTILVYDLIVMVKLLITYTKMTIVFDKSYRVVKHKRGKMHTSRIRPYPRRTRYRSIALGEKQHTQ